MWLNLFSWDSHRTHTCKKVLFVVFLFIFPVHGSVNLFHRHHRLPEPHAFPAPMCFFLTHLSLLDASLTSVSTPKMTFDLLYRGNHLLGGCLTQIFMEHFLGASESSSSLSWPMIAGHLQASALYNHHATGALPAPGGGGLDRGILHATVQILFTELGLLLVPMSLITSCANFYSLFGNFLQRHLQAWIGGGSQHWGHGLAHFFCFSFPT